MRKIPLFGLTALALALLAQAPAQATTLPYKGLDRLVAEADGIVMATVSQVQSREEAPKDIYTYVTFDQLDVLGGKSAASTLTLRLRGGRAGNDILQIDGTPSFEPGERVLLFVQGNGRDLVPLVGWTQGVFRLTTDAQGRAVVADGENRPVAGLADNQVVLSDDTRAHDENLHMLGAPDAQVGRHAAAAGQSGGGSTEDGSASRLVASSLAQAAPAMPAASFLSAVKKRIAQRALGHQPFGQLTSVEPGSPLTTDHADARSTDTRANGAVVEMPESLEPQLPARAATPAQAQ